jgi:hypothetical protein
MHFVMQQRRATKHILLHDCMLQRAASRRGACAARCSARRWRGTAGARLLVRRGVDRLVVGSQAFNNAYGFNADIGAWNTASMKDMSSVCAPSALHIYTQV